MSTLPQLAALDAAAAALLDLCHGIEAAARAIRTARTACAAAAEATTTEPAAPPASEPDPEDSAADTPAVPPRARASRLWTDRRETLLLAIAARPGRTNWTAALAELNALPGRRILNKESARQHLYEIRARAEKVATGLDAQAVAEPAAEPAPPPVQIELPPQAPPPDARLAAAAQPTPVEKLLHPKQIEIFEMFDAGQSARWVAEDFDIGLGLASTLKAAWDARRQRVPSPTE